MSYKNSSHARPSSGTNITTKAIVIMKGNCLLFFGSISQVFTRYRESPASLTALYKANDVDQENHEQAC